MRHAFDGVGGNANRARAWAKLFVRHWPVRGPARPVRRLRAASQLPVLLLWGEEDPCRPTRSAAREALDLLADAPARGTCLPEAGFLVAYDDPVGLARELIAFCGLA